MNAQDRFQQIQRLAAEDREYRELQRRCEELDAAFLSVMEGLSQEERGVVMAYIRALGASALRLAEIACETT